MRCANAPSIVKGLVDLHGGTFDLKSRQRQGTEVKITFPRNRVMQPTSTIAAFTPKALAAPTSILEPVGLRVGHA